MRVFQRIFVGCAIAVAAAAAQAEFWDGNKLYERLTSEVSFNQGAALGYVMGVADTTLGVLHCAPATATAGQLQDMVTQHLRVYPERRTRTADSLVIDTLKAAWPCANNRGGRTL